MDYGLILSNLGSYWIQLTALLAAGAVLVRLLGVKDPRTRLACYQALLAAALLLPLLEPWQHPKASPLIIARPVATAAAPVRSDSAPVDWEQIAVAAFATGCLLRLTWLALGLIRLKRYRREARPLSPLPDAVLRAQQTAGARAEWLESPWLAGPVTFGLRRPVVLVPTGFANLPAESQLAIAAHELTHVRRRDWIANLAESAAGTLLWFHPLVWWLEQRLRLTREQIVDFETVRLTGSKDAYVAALLSSARRVQPDLAPAPTFLFRRGLERRVRTLFEEVPIMSRSRLATSLSCFALTVSAAAWLAVAHFPLTAAPQSAEGYARVDPASAAQVLFQHPVRYPMAARRAGVEGFVTLEVTIEPDGTVGDAHVVSGPDALRRAALESILEWHFANEAHTRKVTTVSIEFKLSEPTPATTAATIRKIDVSPAAGKAHSWLTAQLAPYVDQPATQRSLQEIANIIRPFGLELAITQTNEAGVQRTELRAATRAELASSAVPVEPDAQRIRIGGNVQSAKLKIKPAPVYPPLAKQSRIQGTVRFDVVIAKDGAVKNLQLVNGHPLLVEAAQQAVQQWVYEPTWLNGQPVEVATRVDVNFTLQP